MEGLAAGIQDLLVPMGLVRSEAAGMSAEFVEMAGDIASFNNVPVRQVLEDIASALVGSSEPMLKYGADTRVAALEAIALEEGLVRQGEALTRTAMAQAVFLAIQQGTTDAMGDASRTVDSASNSFKFLARDSKEASEMLGEVLLPVVTPLVQHITKLAKGFNALSQPIKVTIVAVAGLMAVAGPLLATVALLIKTWAGLKIAFAALTPAIGVTIAAVAALAAWAVLIIKEWEVVKLRFALIWTAIKASVIDAVDRVLRTLEMLTQHIPVVGDKVSALREGFNKLADESLARSNDQLIAMEQHIASLAPAIERTADAVGNLNTQAGAFGGGATAGAAERGVVGEGLAGIAPTIRLPDLISPTQALRMIRGETEKTTESMVGLGDEMESIAARGVDAFVSFAGGAGSAIKSFVDDALKQLARFAIFKAIGSVIPGFGAFMGLGPTIPGLQHGGPVHPGQSYMVGERGPELFTPSQAGHIQPNGAMTLRFDTSSLPPYP
jgi:hypothetical protein